MMSKDPLLDLAGIPRNYKACFIGLPKSRWSFEDREISKRDSMSSYSRIRLTQPLMTVCIS